MKIPSFKLGDLQVKVPIIQGGMGVGVSLAKLAAAVANEGGIGIISGAQPGFKEEDFKTDNDGANVRGLAKEIQEARRLSPEGIIGVNFLAAAHNYKELVLAAVKEKADLIISGAGLPSTLPGLVKGSETKIAPIVSSGKAAKTIAKVWDRKFNYLPDAVIVEGPEAGGHLGFSPEDLEKTPMPDLRAIVSEVIEALKPFEEKYERKVPVIAAGGIYDGKDIASYLKLGAAGVQMATRFVATDECDAHINFKQAYVDATAEDITIIKSPVGLPGRALLNNFVKRTYKENIPVTRCYLCLKHCNPADTPYCITDALVASVEGDVDNGLVFMGSNANRVDKIVSVKELMNELVTETESFLDDLV